MDIYVCISKCMKITFFSHLLYNMHACYDIQKEKCNICMHDMIYKRKKKLLYNENSFERYLLFSDASMIICTLLWCNIIQLYTSQTNGRTGYCEVRGMWSVEAYQQIYNQVQKSWVGMQMIVQASRHGQLQNVTLGWTRVRMWGKWSVEEMPRIGLEIVI